MKVSIISIAKSENEFSHLVEILNNQTFKNFEFIGEVGGTIPEAWNRAVKRAQGEILVFTETDAKPVDENWLAELASAINDEKTIVKGLEITGTPLDFSNMAAPRSAFQLNQFDESYKWAEDTELFCRLVQQGYRFIQLEKAPVIHLQKNTSRKLIRRAFLYGFYYARIRSLYTERVEVAGFNELFKSFIKSTLNLFGFMIGAIVYFPYLFNKKNTHEGL
jgi:GT2 family glycosyltransferase